MDKNLKRFYLSIREEKIANPKYGGYRGGIITVHDILKDTSNSVMQEKFLVPEDLFEKFIEVFDGYKTDLKLYVKINTIVP